jgi:hypothetical protein
LCSSEYRVPTAFSTQMHWNSERVQALQCRLRRNLLYAKATNTVNVDKENLSAVQRDV